MRVVGLATVLLAVALLGCAQDSGESIETTVSGATTTVEMVGEPPSTLPPTTTTEVAEPWPGELTAEGAFFVARDLRYGAERDGYHPRLVDLFVPKGEGPWPVAIAYHADPTYNTKSTMYQLGSSLADAGVLTFIPNWGGSGLRTPDELREWAAGGKCTYWYAAEHAPLVGGDPNDITLIGFSGGVNHALNLTRSGGDEAPDCASSPSPVEASALVLFEGDYYSSPWWDSALAADPTLYEDLAIWTDLGEYESGPLHVLVDLWTRDSVYKVMTLLSDKTMDEYLALREPDGGLEADLGRLGAMDDGDIDLIEMSKLFQLRATEAGLEVTWTEIEQAPHAMTPTAIDAIVSLVVGQG